jgi:hypothetical protein
VTQSRPTGGKRNAGATETPARTYELETERSGYYFFFAAFFLAGFFAAFFLAAMFYLLL